MLAKDVRGLTSELSSSSDGVFHLSTPYCLGRVIPWEAMQTYVASRGGCPCEPGTATAWAQYVQHLEAAVHADGVAPDHSVEADYGAQGRLLTATVGVWRTVQHLAAGHGFEAVKPSPRKTMVLAQPGAFRHAEIEWMPSTSPVGDRLFRFSLFQH